MGVFGEKHTSLTREQKRQLIHQADTHKLRPTEVCDWVQKTWGLRIARVTVYSILHKQRASLMAGHKDLYQSMQSSQGDSNSSSSPPSSSSTNQQRSSINTYAENKDAFPERNKNSGRVNKYRASPNKNKNKSKGKDADPCYNAKASHSKRSRNTSVPSVPSDRSISSGSPPLEGSGEGARWEGQLKRVREPASVELDRAMVEFLKGPISVDSQGRRLNDAELQSHALRLAKTIPSASRMRCSFGWLRHFKRRLGVQWAADKLGRYRWIVELDHQSSGSEGNSSSTASSLAPLANDTDAMQEHNIQGRHGSVMSEDDEEYHSNEFGREASLSPRMRSNDSVSPILQDSSMLSIPTTSHGHTKSQQYSFPGVFGTLPPLHVPSSTTTMGTISPLATTLDPKLTSTVLSPPTTSSSAFGMSVDGKMRKVPTKEEAYEMLQSLLMYYEQDHSYIGEQQTLLLPRWIHQQRQIMQQTPENEAKTMWFRQQPQQQSIYHQFQQSLQQSFMFPFQSTDSLQLSMEVQHPYHRLHSSFSSTISSEPSPTLSPSLSPVSPVLPLTPQSPTMDPFRLGFTGAATTAGFSDSFIPAKSDVPFSSAAGLGQQILSADHSLLFSC
ncbi:hypothetical protein BGZ65_000283 [Modicella reniformis]|uniref:HTH CENPB-type domain-containing protein n=1 Tax=Modicella reniformis TaxID=1440133 RepID=A0A9P6LTB5_9FUNG|nr:hypothetical protein BGZ65_000283 [Modicella reniformis]